MKMKKGLLSVAALLATSSVMAAMSFSEAKVESDMNVTVTSSDKALLALTPGKHNAAGINSKGELEIDLDKGYQNKQYGVQNDSLYTWNKLFSVTNNSENKVFVDIDLDKEDIDPVFTAAGESGAKVSTTRHNSDDYTLKIKDGKADEDVRFYLEPGQTKWVNIEVDTEFGSKNDNRYDVQGRSHGGGKNQKPEFKGFEHQFEIDVEAKAVGGNQGGGGNHNGGGGKHGGGKH